MAQEKFCLTYWVIAALYFQAQVVSPGKTMPQDEDLLPEVEVEGVDLLPEREFHLNRALLTPTSTLHASQPRCRGRSQRALVSGRRCYLIWGGRGQWLQAMARL